ncbi:PilN domain-containing protein [Methylophilus sp. 14]|uniref:PilN domain-containing protein n=1 Tax=Methylophilus sp. 14 TaxID=2781019 RepID=UPI00188F18FD|nr:PilN domain-containing protein [Methylophilus sp. 14]MBF4989293.1 PilN domain-containing protein [Methylophilus sp. 14]
MWPNPNYQLEFSRPAFAWQLLRWPGAVLVMLLGVLVAVKYAGVTDTEVQLQQLAQRQQQLIQQQTTATTAAHSPVNKVAAKQTVRVLSQPEQKAAEKIVQQLNVRWFDLLQALESQQVPEIALLQLLPDANRAQFVLSGEAKSYQDLLKYMSQLQVVPVLKQVHLQKHQVNESHPQRPVSFEIQGGWQP